MPLTLRFAARSDVGLVRGGNEDSGYAGPHLLVVADGMGGHAAGEVASSVAVSTLAILDDDPPGSDPLDHLAASVRSANLQLRDMTTSDPVLEGMGTTVTAMLSVGSRVGLVHVGDSRAYLLRGGEFQQITRDHTFVQSLVDEGRISAEEADHHPQKSLIMRALDGRDDLELDLSVREIQDGDRFLLCSDGLSGVVSHETLAETLSRGDPAEAADALVELALRGGGPDNITCLVADVVEDETVNGHPVVVGAATDERPRRGRQDFAASRAAALTARDGGPDTEPDEPGTDGGRPRWAAPLLLFLLLALVVIGGAFAGWQWTKSQYYVGAHQDKVAIFQGVDQGVLGIDLSTVHDTDTLPVNELPAFERERVNNTINSTGLGDAERIVDRLRGQACAAAARDATPTPTPEPSPTDQPSPPDQPPGNSPSPQPTPTGQSSPQPTDSPTSSPQPTASPTPSPTPTVPGVDCSDVEASP